MVCPLSWLLQIVFSCVDGFVAGDEEDERAHAAGQHGLSEKLGLGRLNANMRAWRVWPWLASSTGAVAPTAAEREVVAAS